MMKSKALHFVLFFFLQIGFAQNNLLWKGYFSYNEIKAISESETTVYAAAENALFSQNLSSNKIKTTNTIDGLSGQTISALYYSSTFKKTLVGYEDGLIIVRNESDGTIQNVVDIVKKQLPSNNKKINHFLEHNGLFYIACDFGIVQFNLATLQFGDTYFIGPSGEEISVNQTAIFNNEIYAVTPNFGIRKGNLSNPNLIDYQQWQVFDSNSCKKIVSFNNQLVACKSDNRIYKHNGFSFTEILNVGQEALSFKAVANYLIATTASRIYIFNPQLAIVRQINSNQISENTVSFTCATVVGETVFIGTKENGLLSTTIAESSLFENNTPAGPTRNNIFALDVTPNVLWAVYGGYSGDYNPYAFSSNGYPNSYGISKFTPEGWLHIPYENLLGAKAISRISVNPNNENQVYASSFFSGLLKIENDIPTFLYNQNNSSLQQLIDPSNPNYRNDVRINGTAFDKSGNLWVNNSLVDRGLSVLKTNGQWQSYSLGTILKNSVDGRLGRMIIDKNGTKWFCSDTNGLIGFNESNTKFKKITLGTDEGNLPTSDVRAIAIDTRNQLWIGTARGLRILSNVNSFLTEDQMTTRPIIILEDELAQELFYEQFITDIVVDGANNKWVGTGDSGVFLVSSDGQQTQYHFTKDNSPLPSNTINDIAINPETGEVFFATDKGTVSFKGTATQASEDLNTVYVYPNPVRPEFQGTVKISGLLDKSNVKITDVQGNLVHETTSEGGTIEWDTTAFGKYKVSSGVYMIFVSAQDGIETKVKKVMIIR
jgi:hypothetical protein